MRPARRTKLMREAAISLLFLLFVTCAARGLVAFVGGE